MRTSRNASEGALVLSINSASREHGPCKLGSCSRAATWQFYSNSVAAKFIVFDLAFHIRCS
jgi:hypothetical protein